MLAERTHAPRFGPMQSDYEADCRARVARAHARVANFDSPFADPRVRRALSVAQAYARAAVAADELTDAVRQVERAAADAQARAAGSVWTVAEGRRAASAIGEHRAARAVADALADALDPTGCRHRPSPAFDAAWLTADVLALARAAAQAGTDDVLPILADALQEAGCENPAILDHCRGPGPHAAGCWARALIPTAAR